MNLEQVHSMFVGVAWVCRGDRMTADIYDENMDLTAVMLRPSMAKY
ncbi:hypothetical protein [Planktothricoides sp. SR001]|nr:hypothetical protein [Planktothricoides sp. SR001]